MHLSPANPSVAFLRRRRLKSRIRWRGRVFSRPFPEQLEERTLLTAELVSVTAGGTAGALTSTNPAISANGRYVAFQSRATDLVFGFTDANGGNDVFVRDLILDTTVLISRVGARAGDGTSFDPDISDSGRFVTFVSFATNLSSGTTDDNGVPDVFVHDRDADVDGVFDEPGATRTALLSVSPAGTSGTGASGGGPLGASPTARPRISGDGRFVTFGTLAADLAVFDPTPVDGPVTDMNGGLDVMKARIADGALELVSINFALTSTGTGSAGTVSASNPSISRDGSRVAFESTETTMLDPSVFDSLPPFPPPQIYVGAGSGRVSLVSVTPDGRDIGDGASREPVISRNGRHVAFVSKATDLVAGATNTNGFADDIFARDLKTSKMTLVSRSRAAPGPLTTGDGASPSSAVGEFFDGPVISDTGRFIAFQSTATDLLDPSLGVADTNGLPDIFIFDRDSDLDGVFDEPDATSTILVSVNSAGTDSPGLSSGFCSSFAPALSGDGRLVAFNSTCEDLVPGVSGTNVYVRDLFTGATTLISATVEGGGGGVGSLAGAPRSVAISGSGDRVAFMSDTVATGLDPLIVADANLGSDVFSGTPPPDIRVASFLAGGLTSGWAVVTTRFESVGPAAIGVYRSADSLFSMDDELLDTTTFVPALIGLSASLASTALPFSIGDATDEWGFPGAGATESEDDYFILLVADHLDAIGEFDSDPFAEDNTGLFSVAYHESGGPVFIHGREGATASGSADKILATATATDLTVTLTGAISRTLTYKLADVTGLRVRAHSGDDAVTGSPLPDFIHGGAGKDALDGGAGPDRINGGLGADAITGGPGDDILFDGLGDDIVDAGLGDDTIMATPGGKDLFRDTGGGDTLDFSLASLPITLDLDSTAEQTVDSAGNTIRLVGTWESFIGSPFDDDSTVFAKPLAVPRRLDGGQGVDRLIFDALGLPATFDGTTFLVQGFAPVTVLGFENIQTINAAPRILDDGGAGYSETGNWLVSDPNFPQGFNGGVRFNATGAGDDVATWNFTNVPPGRYAVSATWTFAGDRAKNSPFTIRNGGPAGPPAVSLAVNQEQNPGEFDAPEDGQNIQFRNLAVVDVTGHELTVQLSDAADQFVAADAIRIETLEALGTSPVAIRPTPRIMDDGDVGFTSTCSVDSLANSAANRGAFGDRRRCSLATDVTTWDFGVVPPGEYQLSMTWIADANNPPNAAFQLQVGAELFAVQVNQQQAPDDFQDGEISFEVIAEQVIALDQAVQLIQSGPGIADAVYLQAIERSLDVLYTSNLVILPTLSEANLPDSAINPTIGEAHSKETFVLRNTGVGPLTVDQIQVHGTGFQLLNPLLAPFVLPPNGRETFEVEFNGDTLGSFNGAVVVQHGGLFNNPYMFDLVAKVVQDSTPPTVTLVSPPGQAEVDEVIEGASLRVRAEATDDLGVMRVEFLVDGHVVGTDAESPFETEIQVPIGVDPLIVGARAFDHAGNTGDSPPLVLGVVPDQEPVLVCDPPGGSFIPAGLITVTCTATDDVNVTRVEFVANGTVFQTITEEPFVAQFVVPTGQVGIEFLARAFDSKGNADEASFRQTIFQTPIMTRTSIAVGSEGFSTNDAHVPGEFLIQPVRVFDYEAQLAEKYAFFPYGSDFRGGVRVATGDLNNDGTPDIITGVGSGASGGHVKVFSGVNGAELRSFLAFPGYPGGVSVAGGDYNHDGFDDIIVGADTGASGGHVKVFSGQSNAELDSFFAFPSFTSGVTVAGGDVNGDGFADVIAGASGGQVKVYSGSTGAEIRSFLAFPGFAGGVTVTGGDLDSDGFDDIVVGAGVGATGGHVKVFDGATSSELKSFFAYPEFSGGVRVATGDVNGDSTPDIITAPGSGASPHVKVFDGVTLKALDSFFAFDAGFTGGLWAGGVLSPPVTVVRLPAVGGVFEAFENNGDVVVRQPGGGEVFRGPQADNPRLRIDGSANVNDRLIVNLDGLSTAITFDGGEGGNDDLRLDGSFLYAAQKHQFLSGDDGLMVLDPGVSPSIVKFFHLRYLGLEPIADNLGVVDRVFTFPDTDDDILFNTGDNDTDSILRIDSNNSEVVDFQQPTGSMTLESAANDTVDIGTGWMFEDTEVVDGQFVRILKRNMLILRMIGPLDWGNPIHRLDVNASNAIESLDALLIINELNDPRFHATGGRLFNAAELTGFPDFFYDVSLDGFVAPLDALLVINALNERRNPEGEATEISPLPPRAWPVDQVFSRLSDREPVESNRSTANDKWLQSIAAIGVPRGTPITVGWMKPLPTWPDSDPSLSNDDYSDAVDRWIAILAPLWISDAL